MSSHSDYATGYDIQRLERSIETAREQCRRDIERLTYEYATKHHHHNSRYARLYHRHDENARQYHRHPVDADWWWLVYYAVLLIWAVVIVAATAGER